MYTSTIEAEAPTCGVCGRKLAVGFHFTCHICGNSYCYAHAPVQCTHAKATRPSQIPRTRIPK